MLFNSFHFILFFPLVFGIYWGGARYGWAIQNRFLLLASYYFYACWDWRFLFLLIFSTALDYYSGQKISQSNNPKKRKLWLQISIALNLGFLGVFKYYNFFVSEFAQAFSFFHLDSQSLTLKVILPVGISFYTFHGLSYVIDCYYRRIDVCRNFIDYALFVSFFPLLVAGPIERAQHLLPQLQTTRHFEYDRATDGLRQMLWGFFKKLVVADACGLYTSQTFGHPNNFTGSELALGALCFSVQIYGDFSGYSDIALGAARLLGIELLQNFRFPYFSRDIAEFWRRWHISLSSWFRDYLYIPLGGNQGGFWTKVRNTYLVFLVSGFWHGANWTFLVWGALHATLFLPSLLLQRNRKYLNTVAPNRWFPSLKESFQIMVTFITVSVAWIFFRSENMATAQKYFSVLCSKSILSVPDIDFMLKISLLWVFIFFIVEWSARDAKHGLEKVVNIKSIYLRWLIYISLIMSIFIFYGQGQAFIYFQF